ncbi:MAG: hypothetical protein LAN62_03435 [Acidobacteriia bacterium]|nr:hypothetical protein [Terriglobia bacterium]
MPIVAAIPAIIGAGGAIAGGLLSRGGGGSKATEAGLTAESELAKTETEAQKFGTEAAKGLLPQAEGALGKAGQYYSGLLGGDRQKMLEAVGPEVNTILSQYDTAKRAASEFTPRGGGRTAELAELPFKYSGEITSLLQGVRPKAAAGMERLGAEYGSLASSLLARDTGAGNALLNYALGLRGQNIDVGTQIGGSLGALIYQLLNKTGSASSSGSPLTATEAAILAGESGIPAGGADINI